MHRALTFLLQLAVVPVALLLADDLAGRFNLAGVVLPHVKHVDLGVTGLLQVGTVFLAYQLVALLVANWRQGDQPLWRLSRLLSDLRWVLGATSLASCHMFTLTLVPFNPNFYAWVFLLVPALHLAVYAIAARRAGRPIVPPSSLADLRGWALTPASALTCAVVLTPGALAVIYKKVPAFANLVNYTRVSFTTEVDSRFHLADAYPGLSLEQPLDVRFDPQEPEVAYVLERPGRLLRVGPGDPPEVEVLLDITEEVGSTRVESGALSVALHPEFGVEGSSHRSEVFLYYNHWGEHTLTNRLARFDLSGDTVEARTASREVLIDQARPPSGFHNGGTLLFGPDGFLWLGVGDGSDFDTHQRIDRALLGGVFRIDVDRRGGDVSAPIARQPLGGETSGYFVPRDNPFVDRPGALGEFWALGLRNPFRMSFDPQSGELWVGDVGANGWEEVNRVPARFNGQWPYREGPEETWHQRPEQVPGEESEPFFAYRQTALDRAVIGGMVYRGAAYPELTGQYLFADNQSGLVKALDPQDPEAGARVVARCEKMGQQGISCLQADAAGRLFVTVLGAKGQGLGQLLRLEAGGEQPATEAAQAPTYASVAAKYDMSCARCHGADGRGEPGLAAGGTMPARPDFTSPEWQQQASDARIRKVVLEGGAAAGLSPQMPGWKGYLSDEELPFLIERLRAFAGPKGDAK